MSRWEKFTREEQKYNLLTAVFSKLFKCYSFPLSFLWTYYTILRTKNTRLCWTPPYKWLYLVYYSEKWRAIEGLAIHRNKPPYGLMWFPLSVIMAKEAWNPLCLQRVPLKVLCKKWQNDKTQVIGVPRLATSACYPSTHTEIHPFFACGSWLTGALPTNARSNSSQLSVPWL